MYFRASSTIARQHPDLVTLVDALDTRLAKLAGVPLRSDAVAELLDADPDTLARLFHLYQAQGVLAPVMLQLCPTCLDPLEAGEDGRFRCGICEASFDGNTCLEVEAFQVVQAPGAEPTPARSGRKAASGRSHALVIGVGSYPDLPHLATTVHDAADLAEFFGNPAGAGFPPANVGLLLDQQATRSSISLALEELVTSAKPADTIVIYFAGHGIRRVGGFEPGEYLCPIDVDRRSPRATAIHADDLSRALSALPAKQVVVFLDACYSGGMDAPASGWDSTAFGLSDQAVSRLAGGGRVVIASSRSDELSWELASLKRGLFTHYLIEGLAGGAAGPDGAVRVLDLYDYLSTHVPQHEDQHPVIKGSLDSNFVIVPARRPRSGHSSR